MQSPDLLHESLREHYTTAADALAAIGRAYYYDGQLAEARSLLGTALELLGAPALIARQRLKLTLLYGQVGLVEYFLMRGPDAEPVFAAIRQAQQLAEASQDQQGLADALGLHGQAHYFASVVASRAQGRPVSGVPGDGQYDNALRYQERALELRQALGDTRGQSESCFQIGVVYERWSQYARSQEYYRRAYELAAQGDHRFEMTEPARHFAIQALGAGDLDQALDRALHALALREAAGFRPYLPLDHLLLRDIYLARSDTVQAERHAQAAQALAETIGLQALVASMPNIRDALAARPPA